MRQKTGMSIKKAKIRTRQKLLMYIEIAKTTQLKNNLQTWIRYNLICWQSAFSSFITTKHVVVLCYADLENPNGLNVYLD